ncbi:MAG TPA: hypothetical protein VLA79_14765 [Polyangia bacterium]|nr:hypothetical protein [Polyangia bacterium]
MRGRPRATDRQPEQAAKAEAQAKARAQTQADVGRVITSRTLRHIEPLVALRLRHIPFRHFVAPARSPVEHVVKHLTRTAKIFISSSHKE